MRELRELNFALESAGYKATFQYGGITVLFPTVTIAIGQDDDKKGLFMVNIQEDFEFGPQHTSLDDQRTSDVMELCFSHAPAVPAQGSDLIGLR